MTGTTHLTPEERAALIARNAETDAEKETRDAIHAALDADGAELRELDRRRAEVMQHIGDVLRLAKTHNDRNPEPWLKVEVTRAMHETGLSRPTLYALRDRPLEQWRPVFDWPSRWTPDWELARLSTVYEDDEERLHRRYPDLGGLNHRRTWITSRYLDELDAAGTPWNPFDDLELPPHLEALCEESDKAYRDAVRDMAKGPLGAATPPWWDDDAAEEALRAVQPPETVEAGGGVPSGSTVA